MSEQTVFCSFLVISCFFVEGVQFIRDNVTFVLMLYSQDWGHFFTQASLCIFRVLFQSDLAIICFILPGQSEGNRKIGIPCFRQNVTDSPECSCVLLCLYTDRGLQEASSKGEGSGGGSQQVAATGRDAQRFSKEARDTALQHCGKTHTAGV